MLAQDDGRCRSRQFDMGMPCKQQHSHNLTHVKRQNIIKTKPDHHEGKQIASRPEFTNWLEQQRQRIAFSQ